MEVTVIETGDLPSSTVISFHTGSIRRHAPMELNKEINLSYVSGTEPVRVDLMSQIGSHTFDMVQGQDTYEVPIASADPISRSEEGVRLKFQIREAPVEGTEAKAVAKDVGADETESQGSPSRKLQTALVMRNYLDSHGILRQMQELLQSMIDSRPEDPMEYMIQYLEDVCRDSQALEVEPVELGTIVKEDPSPTSDDPQQEKRQAAAEETVAQEDDAGSDDESEGEDSPEPAPLPSHCAKSRRTGVSAEAMKDDDSSWTPPVYPKSPEERQQLSDIIRTSHDSKLHMLFGTVSKETFEHIIDAMDLKAIAQGESVIKQGAVGDYFYIVKSGDFDIIVKKGEDPPKKVFEAGVGFAFGELALLYNADRSATITATVASEVWCLDRTAFRNLVVRSSQAQHNMFVDFLNGVDLFQVLNGSECASLAEVLEEEEFEDDEAIVEQGEKDDKMFILRRGKAVACIRGEQGEVEVMQYSPGDFFGEIALLSGEPRKASIYAVGDVSCLYISRPTFLRVLGPLQSLLERSIDKYEKYQTAIAAAAAEADQENPEVPECARGHGGGEEDHFDGGALQTNKAKVVHRKRERQHVDKASEMKVDKKVVSEMAAEEGEPASLADKVAQDFKNAALVTPTEQFALKDSLMMMYGGVVPDQKFKMDKAIHVNSVASAVMKGDEELYSWSGPTKLKSPTDIGVICQKGQKSASDPTPNQDNFFVHSVGAVTMYGVCDGHGPFGHLVSFRLVQTLPYFLTKSEHFVKEWDLALKQAFSDAQKDLVEFCAAQNINIEASGAAGTVLVLEEQTVHIAFIGDARIMLGSYNRRDSRLIFCTQDHKPDLPDEKARLEAAGSEVREIEPGNHRIYLPGSNFPGLTMSRAFGDTACGGVLREPEYHKYLMQPNDQWYAIVASDGVWEFMEGEEVCNLTSKKLRLKGPTETLHFLVNASRKRWDYCCGDYCDDITAVLVQWNTSDSKDSKNNHSLTVKRPS